MSVDTHAASAVDARHALVNAGRRLDALGLAPASSGNLSLRTDAEIVISPSGGSLATIVPEDVAELDFQGEWRSGGTASKEAPLHLAFYDRDPSIGAVVHLHSEFATALACREPWSAASALPPITPYFLMRVGQTPLLPFAPPGSSALKDELVALEGDVRSVLLANHGSLVAGEDLAGALDAAIELESAARAHLRSEGPRQRPLRPEHIDELRRSHVIRWPAT